MSSAVVLIANAAVVAALAAPFAQDTARLSPEYEEKNLITRIEPIYPAKAKRAHVQGVVRLTIAIGKDGHVLEIRSVRGHRLLAAAVRQWVYRPLLLGGEPIEVVTEVDVNFSLPAK